jgi:hypothetical protein
MYPKGPKAEDLRNQVGINSISTGFIRKKEGKRGRFARERGQVYDGSRERRAGED